MIAPFEWGSRLSVGAAELVEHEVGSIVELDREPVPADLPRLEKARAEFVIHPAFSGHFDRLPIDDYRATRSACGSESSSAKRCRGITLLADTVLSLDDWCFTWCKVEFDRHGRITGAEKMVSIWIMASLPVLIPDPIALLIRSCPANTGTVHPLGVPEVVTIEVAHGKVGSVEVPNCPA
jgi:hypothetical protein